MTSAHHFVASSRVEGAPVFDTEGHKLGRIEDLMLDRETGAPAYALLGHDGFLGLDLKFYPVPWSLLSYDADQAHYVAPITRDQLAQGPAVVDREINEECEWRERVHAYYGASPYWLSTPAVM